MNAVNTLFVICTIMVPLLLISLSYSTIQDFYKYSVPLNTLVLGTNFSFDTSEEHLERFNHAYNHERSECFTTPNDNTYCFIRVLDDGTEPTATQIIGDNGINGEIHFDSAEEGGAQYFLMLNMTKGKNDSAILTFGDKGHKIGADGHAALEDSEEFSMTIKPLDSFISHCNTKEGKSVTIVQFLGIKEIHGIDHFVTWHLPADSETGVVCEYPEIIQHSLNHDFGI